MPAGWGLGGLRYGVRCAGVLLRALMPAVLQLSVRMSLHESLQGGGVSGVCFAWLL